MLGGVAGGRSNTARMSIASLCTAVFLGSSIVSKVVRIDPLYLIDLSFANTDIEINH